LAIAGLDMERGINHFGGDEDSYLDVLRSYAVNTPPLLETIKNVDREHLGDYAIVVHGIKGSSRGICADDFAGEAEVLENSARAGDYDFIAAHNQSFLDTAWKLMSDIDVMLSQLSAVSPKPMADRPDKEVLDKLLIACRNYDMDGADEAMAEIRRFDYVHDDGLADWLNTNIEQMNFPQIIDRLSGV
jgi:hypothetical protein